MPIRHLLNLRFAKFTKVEHIASGNIYSVMGLEESAAPFDLGFSVVLRLETPKNGTKMVIEAYDLLLHYRRVGDKRRKGLTALGTKGPEMTNDLTPIGSNHPLCDSVRNWLATKKPGAKVRHAGVRKLLDEFKAPRVSALRHRDAIEFERRMKALPRT